MFYFALTNKLVSIHAPTWGATRHGNRYSRRILFQSTHPHEVRPYLGLHPYFYLKFQSTHPHRVRLKMSGISPNGIVFQSTHPHRVRLTLSVMCISITSFNPRTHIGCDRQQLSTGIWRRCFNPRTHIGCD